MASDRIWGNPQEKTVILDTNAVLMLFEFSIDLHAELSRLIGGYHLVVPGSVVQELQKIAENGEGKRQQNAKAGLSLIRTIEVITVEGARGDEAVFELAHMLNGFVVTNDKALRKRLYDDSVPVIFMRKKQTLCLESKTERIE